MIGSPAEARPGASPLVAVDGGSHAAATRQDAREQAIAQLLEMIAQNEASYSRIMNGQDEATQRAAIRALAESNFESVELPAGVFLSRSFQAEVIEELCNEILGFGPIAPLIRDHSINEIMVNGPDRVFIEQGGVIRESGVRFRSVEHLRTIIQKIVWRLGRRIDETSPLVDARLPDGSRVNAAMTPVALTGPYLTIRKFPEAVTSFDALVARGSLSIAMADFLRMAVKARLNMIVSGGTSTGKTTLLNVLASETDPRERIVTVEDAAELRLSTEHRNVCAFEAKPMNIEGRGAVTIRDLVRNSLRMRPDRLIVGEVRGAEALDMLQAMNTGHDGSFATAHANTAHDLFSRLETMVCMAATELPVSAIMDIIVSALQLIVHVHRFSDGARRITQIVEVRGVGVDGRIVTTPVWTCSLREESGGVTVPVFHYHGISAQLRERFAEYKLGASLLGISEAMLPSAPPPAAGDVLVGDLLERLSADD